MFGLKKKKEESPKEERKPVLSDEEIKQRNRVYRKNYIRKHPEYKEKQKLAYSKWANKNKDKINEKYRKWYSKKKEDPEFLKYRCKINSRWAKNNREKINKYRKKRYYSDTVFRQKVIQLSKNYNIKKRKVEK